METRAESIVMRLCIIGQVIRSIVPDLIYIAETKLMKNAPYRGVKKTHSAQRLIQDRTIFQSIHKNDSLSLTMHSRSHMRKEHRGTYIYVVYEVRGDIIPM